MFFENPGERKKKENKTHVFENPGKRKMKENKNTCFSTKAKYKGNPYKGNIQR